VCVCFEFFFFSELFFPTLPPQIITSDGWKLSIGLTGPPDGWSPPNSSGWGAGFVHNYPNSDDTIIQVSAKDGPFSSFNCSAAFDNGQCLPGNDIISGGVASTSAEDCCSRCSDVVQCIAWTWRVDQQRCYVKSSAGKPQFNSSCISASEAPGNLILWPLSNMTVQLFDLNNDPWERNDVSSLYPTIVTNLTNRLAYWGNQAVTPLWYNAKVDPNSPPSKRNGTWTPWL
jgi:PAN domain